MKKTILLFIILFSLFSLFAETSTKFITAFKKFTTGTIPDNIVSMRILNPENNDVMDDDDIEIPKYTRQASYVAFKWILVGYRYGEVKVRFTFGPMLWRGVETSSENRILPYTATINHLETRVGSNMVAPTSDGNEVPCDFLTNVKYRFADTITGSGTTLNVTNSNQSMQMTFSFATATEVVDGNGDEVDYSTYNVCNFWTRNGEVKVVLDVSSSGYGYSGETKMIEGEYFANVSVEISTD